MSDACDLTTKSCRPCEGGVEPLTSDEAKSLQQRTPDWLISEDGLRISRTFEFKDFLETMAFINAMAWVAHREDHHPDFSAGYRKCKVTYTTHAIGGLSENDFICAAKISPLAGKA